MFSYLDRELSNGMKVLDWGAGTGFMTYVLSDQFHVSACTPESDNYTIYCDLLKTTCEKYNTDFTFLKDKIRLPYVNNSFDAVLSIGVLEHVAEFGGDEKGSIDEIQRVLNKNGIIFITHLPRRYSYIEFFNRLLNRPHHQFTYRRKDVRSIVSHENLQIVGINKYGILPKYVLVYLHLKFPVFFTKKVIEKLVYLDNILSEIPVLNSFAQNYHVTLRKIV